MRKAHPADPQCAHSELSRQARTASSRPQGGLGGLREMQRGTSRDSRGKSDKCLPMPMSQEEMSSDACHPSYIRANGPWHIDIWHPFYAFWVRMAARWAAGRPLSIRQNTTLGPFDTWCHALHPVVSSSSRWFDAAPGTFDSGPISTTSFLDVNPSALGCAQPRKQAGRPTHLSPVSWAVVIPSAPPSLDPCRACFQQYRGVSAP
jgi:hypothetical protein